MQLTDEIQQLVELILIRVNDLSADLDSYYYTIINTLSSLANSIGETLPKLDSLLRLIFDSTIQQQQINDSLQSEVSVLLGTQDKLIESTEELRQLSSKILDKIEQLERLYEIIQ